MEKDPETGRPSRPVWRLEGRLKRKALHEGGIESLWDLLARLTEIWAYLVGHVGGGEDGLPDGWLRYVVPSDDTNRARWLVDPVWQALQDPFGLVGTSSDGAASVVLGPFIRRRKYEVNISRAIAAFAGYASTAEAFRQIEYEKLGKVQEVEPDISDTFHFLFDEVQSYLEEKSKRKKNADFASVVKKKRVVYHLVAAPVA